jgi:hypothetical protein
MIALAFSRWRPSEPRRSFQASHIVITGKIKPKASPVIRDAIGDPTAGENTSSAKTTARTAKQAIRQLKQRGTYSPTQTRAMTIPAFSTFGFVPCQ